MENGRFNLKVELTVSLPGVERSEAEALAHVAHQEVCPYSRATRGNIDVDVRVT